MENVKSYFTKCHTCGKEIYYIPRNYALKRKMRGGRKAYFCSISCRNEYDLEKEQKEEQEEKKKKDKKDLIYRRFKELINQSGKTLLQISQETGISEYTVRTYSRRRTELSEARIEIFAEYFGVNPEWLRGVSDKKEITE